MQLFIVKLDSLLVMGLLKLEPTNKQRTLSVGTVCSNIFS